MSEQTNGYTKRGEGARADLEIWYLRGQYGKFGVVFVGIGKPLNHIPFSLSSRGSSHLLMLFEMAVIPVNSKQAQCLAHSMA